MYPFLTKRFRYRLVIPRATPRRAANTRWVVELSSAIAVRISNSRSTRRSIVVQQMNIGAPRASSKKLSPDSPRAMQASPQIRIRFVRLRSLIGPADGLSVIGLGLWEQPLRRRSSSGGGPSDNPHRMIVADVTPRARPPASGTDARAEARGLFADDLDADLALPGAVELGEDDGLESTERQLAVVHPDRDVAPEEGGPQMRVRVAALAVGHARVVVPIAVALGHEPLDQRPQIVDQRALELVDEQRAGRVERVDERDPGGDGELLDGVAHELGDVRDLGLLVRRQREGRVVNLHRRAFSAAHRLDPDTFPARLRQSQALRYRHISGNVNFFGPESAKVLDFSARFPSLATALDHAVLGSSRSRSPSPSRLSPSTVRAMAPPGNTANQGFIDRKFCASLSMSPHDGCGGCVPRPRYARPASARIAIGKLVVA